MDISFYPEILTDANWQAKKGAIAKKLGGKTGIGELMKKCQAEHAKVDWPKKYDLALRLRLQIDKFDLTMSKDEIVDVLEKEAMKEYRLDAAPLRKLVAELRDKAKTLAAAWKKKTLIPASSANHAEAVSKAADAFFLALKDDSQSVKDLLEIKKVREGLVKKKEEALKALENQITLCEEGLKAALKNPTKKGWQTGGAHQGCRSVNNSIAAIPALKKLFYPTWNKFGDNFDQDIPVNDPQETEKIKAKVKTVFNELIKFKGAVHKMFNS